MTARANILAFICIAAAAAGLGASVEQFVDSPVAPACDVERSRHRVRLGLSEGRDQLDSDGPALPVFPPLDGAELASEQPPSAVDV